MPAFLEGVQKVPANWYVLVRFSYPEMGWNSAEPSSAPALIRQGCNVEIVLRLGKTPNGFIPCYFFFDCIVGAYPIGRVRVSVIGRGKTWSGEDEMRKYSNKGELQDSHCNGGKAAFRYDSKDYANVL